MENKFPEISECERRAIKDLNTGKLEFDKKWVISMDVEEYKKILDMQDSLLDILEFNEDKTSSGLYQNQPVELLARYCAKLGVVGLHTQSYRAIKIERRNNSVEFTNSLVLAESGNS